MGQRRRRWLSIASKQPSLLKFCCISPHTTSLHPPHSPDLAPPDFHLIRSPSENLRGNSVNDHVALQNWFGELFISKSSEVKRGGEHLLDWFVYFVYLLAQVFCFQLWIQLKRYELIHQCNVIKLFIDIDEVPYLHYSTGYFKLVTDYLKYFCNICLTFSI